MGKTGQGKESEIQHENKSYTQCKYNMYFLANEKGKHKGL